MCKQCGLCMRDALAKQPSAEEIKLVEEEARNLASKVSFRVNFFRLIY